MRLVQALNCYIRKDKKKTSESVSCKRGKYMGLVCVAEKANRGECQNAPSPSSVPRKSTNTM
jgi:hypothetical protein